MQFQSIDDGIITLTEIVEGVSMQNHGSCAALYKNDTIAVKGIANRALPISVLWRIRYNFAESRYLSAYMKLIAKWRVQRIIMRLMAIGNL